MQPTRLGQFDLTEKELLDKGVETKICRFMEKPFGGEINISNMDENGKSPRTAC
jgi:hypothetical protein